MKFSDIAAGTRALSDAKTVEIAPGVTITVKFRRLAPFESGQVLSAARADAKAAGVESPEPGDEIYERERAVHTLAYGVVDPDDKSETPTPFFDGGPEQIRHHKLMTDDVIEYLYELWELWADSVSLQKMMLDETAFARVMEEAAVGNARPFLELRRGQQWNCIRTMAARHLSLLRLRSPSGSGSLAMSPSPLPPEPPQNQNPDLTT
jgi:hypothetical protein